MIETLATKICLSQTNLRWNCYLVHISLLNFLYFWFSIFSRYVGVHAKLISRLLRRDIPQFLIVYIVVGAAFLGSVILALTATKEGFDNAEYVIGLLRSLFYIQSTLSASNLYYSNLSVIRTNALIPFAWKVVPKSLCNSNLSLIRRKYLAPWRSN